MKIMPAGLRFILAFGMCLYSLGVVADDTEIFFNIPDSNVKPNLLFVLDNSGSMAAEVETLSTYDNSQTYSGSYSSSYYYFNGDNALRKVSISNIECSDIKQRMQNTGKVISYKMAYNLFRWRSFSDSDVSRKTDCEADNDIDVTWRDITAKDFYSANYVNWYYGHRVVSKKTRLQVVQDVARNLADSMTGVNIGLMAFNTVRYSDCGSGCGDATGEGGHVILPMGDIRENRDAFKNAISGLKAETNTPLAETLFEAMRYFKGEEPFLDRNPKDSAVSGGQYVSPIEFECQANSVIFLTDGEPTRDENHKATMERLIGSCTGNCMDEIAAYMNTTDIHPLPGEQTVSTYTIGFQTDQALLNETARKGGGAYYKSEDATSLETALDDIFRDVMATSATFVAPGVAVNSFNRLNHLDALYFSVFEPDTRPRWVGNIKRYRLDASGLIYDADGTTAVDPATGFFKAGARSWWSSESDGPDVEKGGVAHMHPANHADRKVYTYLDVAPNKNLTAPANAVHVDNKGNITKAVLGAPDITDAEHEQLLNWIRGAKASEDDGASRKFLADSLHSVPHLIIVGGNEESPETALFFGDNQGFLHAVDGKTGKTFFSFMPLDLLANQKRLFDNKADDTGRPYGIDGSIISWVNDKNGNGVISQVEDDHAFIYTGMRRGGRNYYALDVTDVSAPKMMWTIKGGVGDFSELGQSWSKPVKTKLKINDTLMDVLIIGGGYDPQQDEVTTRTSDSQGRAIFIVDARTGERLWWAGPTGSGADLELAAMNYSIPASVKILDMTGDGITNQIYVGDMGGQVWRFDINNGSTRKKLVTGAVLAQLGGADEANNRRFYHAPDLSGTEFGGSRHLALIIGSGWQAHPLNRVIDDRIYMLRIPEVTSPPTDETGKVAYYTLTEDSLYDVTENLIQQGEEDQQLAGRMKLGTSSGWYIRLNAHGRGEKVLSATQTVNHRVFITTYEPAPSSNACAPSAGISRLYNLSVIDGVAVVDYDGNGELKHPDRVVKVLQTTALPPDPQRLRVGDQDLICVGMECPPIDTLQGVVKTYWHAE